jgi:hypothetical protein
MISNTFNNDDDSPYYRAGAVLSRGGLVCVSLADRQAGRWALAQVAACNGFLQVAAHPFPLLALPGKLPHLCRLWSVFEELLSVISECFSGQDTR